MMISPARSFHFISSARNKKTTTGFTLIETLAVVGLSLVVIIIVSGALFYGARSSARARAGIIKKQEVLKQFHRIRFQLLNLYKSDGDVLVGEEGAKEGG